MEATYLTKVGSDFAFRCASGVSVKISSYYFFDSLRVAVSTAPTDAVTRHRISPNGENFGCIFTRIYIAS